MKKILILEDDLIIQRLYKRALDKIHNLHIVGTIADALVALDESRPDVFLSDMRLPDGIGTEAVAYCKEKHPSVPIFIVSGTLDDSKDVQVARKFEKPVSPEALIAAIEEAR